MNDSPAVGLHGHFVTFVCANPECAREQTRHVFPHEFTKGRLTLACEYCPTLFAVRQEPEGSVTVVPDHDARVGVSLGDGPVEIKADVEDSPDVRASDLHDYD